LVFFLLIFLFMVFLFFLHFSLICFLVPLGFYSFSFFCFFLPGAFAYSTDVDKLGEHALGVLQGVDTWIVDCFQRGVHPAHADLDLVRQWAARLGVRRTILTHMGVDMDWAWMARNLPPGLEAAFDGMQLQV